MGPRDRIRQIYQELGISQRSFAESIGMTQTGLSGVLRGVNRASKPLAHSIELKHGYLSKWVLEGEGPKKLSDHEKAEALIGDLTAVYLDALDDELHRAFSAALVAVRLKVKAKSRA